jgi:hypothetical protein
MTPSHNNATAHNDQLNTITPQAEQPSAASTKSILRSVTPANAQARTANLTAAESLREAPAPRRVTFSAVNTVHPIPNRQQLKKAQKEAEAEQRQELADALEQIEQLKAQIAAIEAAQKKS